MQNRDEQNPQWFYEKNVHRQIKLFNEWRKEVSNKLPELVKRIFALRDKTYRGCGFHYGMEKRLGSIILQLNDFERNWDIHCQIGLLVSAEELYQEVERAERSLKERYK